MASVDQGHSMSPMRLHHPPTTGRSRTRIDQTPESDSQQPTDSNWNQISDVSAHPPDSLSCSQQPEEEPDQAEEASHQRSVCKVTAAAGNESSCCLDPSGETSDYHWCEDDDLSENTGQSCSCSCDKEESPALTSESQLIGSDPSYVELAKQIDTNLAHIDMEDFKSEDIHSVLVDYSQNCPLPTSNADMQDSMEETPSSQDDCSLTDASLCKSGPLFSPQRVGTGGVQSEFSTDSLNLDKDEWLDEEAAANQLLLAVDCRTNMTNYTLAWSSASGTDQDVDYNEPGSSSSGSEQSHWSSSGSGGRGNGHVNRAAPPIPPWPAGPRPLNPNCATWSRADVGCEQATLPGWMPRPHLPAAKRNDAMSHRDNAANVAKTSRHGGSHPKGRKDKERKVANFRPDPSKLTKSPGTTIDLAHLKSNYNENKKSRAEDNPSLSDMDNGNEKMSKDCGRSKQHRPVFTKNLQDAPNSQTLSLLEIYMRQKSQSNAKNDVDNGSSTIKKSDDGHDVIASGGGEGWVEEYPSSADEKLGLESVTSSLIDDEDDEDVEEDDDEPLCDQARSLTLTDVSDIDPASIQIDVVPFNSSEHRGVQPPCGSTSLDKLIAKIKPFELGLSPASIEEHCNFESRLRREYSPPEKEDRSIQASVPPTSTKEEGTSTDPVNPPVYVIFPSYSLPDLSFLKKYDYTWIGNTLLSPQDLQSPSAKETREARKVDVDELKKKDLQHIKDWESLNILLPEEIRQLIDDLRTQQPCGRADRLSKKPRPKSCDSGAVLRHHRQNPSSQRSSGYRGSSTMTTWTDSESTLPTVPHSPLPAQESETPPPLPKRTASLPNKPKVVDRKIRSAPVRTNSKLCNDISETLAEAEQQLSSTAHVNQVRFQMTRQKAKTLAEMTPSPCQSMMALRPRSCTFYEPSMKHLTDEDGSGVKSDDGSHHVPMAGHVLRKTVSFGEQLSGGFLKMANSSRRPLSLSNWPGGPLDVDSMNDSVPAVDMEQKKSLVQGVSVAAAQLCKLMHQSLHNAEYEDSIIHSKFISRTLTGSLSPALYHLLSDGLLPTVTTFFGQVTNSIWRVVEASVKKGPTLPWVEELVFCLNNEESLPEGPVRFGVFISELVNMGGLDWWLDNLVSKETILRRHYAPHGFLYLCHTSTRPLMEELRTSLRPLASLPLDYSAPWKHEKTRTAPSLVSPKIPAAPGPAAASTGPNKAVSSPKSAPSILKSPTRSKPQRPLSFVQNSPKKTATPPYRRAQSQHYDTSPKKVTAPSIPAAENQVEEFSSLKKKWESLCGQKNDPPVNRRDSAEATNPASPLRSRIPRPVNRLSK